MEAAGLICCTLKSTQLHVQSSNGKSYDFSKKKITILDSKRKQITILKIHKIYDFFKIFYNPTINKNNDFCKNKIRNKITILKGMGHYWLKIIAEY